jgi:cellulose synthase/poly-beta-1,6-N-acetylglucosamine synthase-like glycosyltransferase
MTGGVLIIGALLLGISAVPYVVYLAGITWGKKQEVLMPLEQYPSISVVISAYNEQKNISDRLENLKACGYPDMEVIFVDDCSTDNTRYLAQETLDGLGFNYHLLFNDEQLGTSKSYNKAIAAATRETVVVTDADVMFKKDALHRIITRLMSSTTIGAVTGDLQPEQTPGETTELEYQYRSIYGRMCEWESAHDSTFNFNGALMAFKKQAVVRIDDKHGADDANIAFAAIRNGYRAVYEKDAVVYESVPESFTVQYKQKIRRATGLLEAMRENDDLVFTPRKFSKFYFLRLWMYFISPSFFLVGLVLSIWLWIPVFILLVFTSFTRAFILNQFYLLAGFLNTGKNVQVWESTSSMVGK